MNDICANIEQLIKDLNEFKPVNERDFGVLKGEVSVDLTENLSKTEERVGELSAELTKQSKVTQDTSPL